MLLTIKSAIARCVSIKSRRLTFVLNLRLISKTKTEIFPSADTKNKILRIEKNGIIHEQYAVQRIEKSSRKAEKRTCRRLSTGDVLHWRPCPQDVNRCRWVENLFSTRASKLLWTRQFPSLWNFDRPESFWNLAFQSFADEQEINLNWHQNMSLISIYASVEVFIHSSLRTNKFHVDHSVDSVDWMKNENKIYIHKYPFVHINKSVEKRHRKL